MVELPDLIAHDLRLDGPEANRRTLEMLALGGYTSGGLTRGKVGALLGLSFCETEEFLSRHGAKVPLTIAEVLNDSAALERLLAR